MTEYGYGDLFGPRPGAAPGEGPAPGSAGGSWTPERIQNILALANSLIGQFQQLRGAGSTLQGFQPGPHHGGPSVSDVSMTDLKLIGKGLIQRTIQSMGDKTIKEILDQIGDSHLSEFERML